MIITLKLSFYFFSMVCLSLRGHLARKIKYSTISYSSKKTSNIVIQQAATSRTRIFAQRQMLRDVELCVSSLTVEVIHRKLNTVQ